MAAMFGYHTYWELTTFVTQELSFFQETYYNTVSENPILAVEDERYATFSLR